MKDITDYHIFLEEKEGGLVLLYLSSENCPLCHGDFPKIRILEEDFPLTLLRIDVERVPLARGQLQVFTVPTVILFSKGREVHRESRFIDFKRLRKRIEEQLSH